MASSSDSELEAFFGAAIDCFSKAAAAVSSASVALRIAERPVRLRFAGTSLTHLCRALRHLAAEHTADEAAALEILAWSGEPAPPNPPWRLGQQSYLGEIVGLGSGRFRINYHDQSGLVCMHDKRSGKVVYWLPESAALPFWELGSPFRVIFHWWAADLGGQMVHAAAVGQDGRGLLLVGRSGSGKSSTALACLDAELSYVGDDYVLLMPGAEPTVHSLYNSAKLHTRFMDAAMPHWRERVAMEIGPERKSLFFLQETMPAALRASLTISGVVVPKIHDAARATVGPCSVTDALLALAPSTIFQLPGARQRTMSFLSNWLRGLPVFAMRTGRDVTSGPAVLRRLLMRPAHALREQEHSCDV